AQRGWAGEVRRHWPVALFVPSTRTDARVRVALTTQAPYQTTDMNLSILYRGPLSSCNYACWYCPFAKDHETAEELAKDRRALERFVDWVASHPEHKIGILFTPWGEALIRRWYQRALVRLTNLAHVRRAAIQTNLSCSLDWSAACDKER